MPTAAPAQTPAAPAQPSSPHTGNIAFSVYNPDIRGYTLYTVKPDGSGLHGLAEQVHHPNYSPNGRRIVVDGTGGGREDLWHFAIDGSDWQQLTRNPDDHYPTWSPSGPLVAFSSTRQGDGKYRLYRTDGLNDAFWKDSRGSFILGDYPVYLPTWDLVFSGCDYWETGSKCGLWRVGSRGELAQLTGEPQDIPTDGNEAEILFLRPDSDNWDVYRIARTGGNPTRLTDDPARDGPAAFSADGQAVAFLSDRSGAWALYIMSRAGANVRKVVDLPKGGGYDAAPYAWNTERISWGALPASTTPPTVTPDLMLAAPRIDLPLAGSTVIIAHPTTVRWSWSGVLKPGQGFDLRLWHTSDSSPQGVAPPTQDKQLELDLSMTAAYQSHGDGFYYLDVVVVQLEPYRVLSKSAPVRVRLAASQ